jgi:HPt (histidine-containing phosphotransfer) domain-containing protein
MVGRLAAADARPVSAPQAQAIDRAHLARMTLGDRALEREVLQLFDRQSELLLARMQDAPPASIAMLAHTLKGSARGTGAFAVAQAAEALETAAGSAPLAPALERLAEAIGEARAAIARLI